MWLYCKQYNLDDERVSFKYDALGRRFEKKYRDKLTKFVWDGNTPLHEWNNEVITEDKDWFGGKVITDTGLTTWVFDADSFVPSAKIQGDKSYSIVSDYLGTPCQAYNETGAKVWEYEQKSYGGVESLQGAINFIPFRYQGQYEDVETGLYYNRFRYYSPEEGNYISQDPIGLNGGFRFYDYVGDTNSYIDAFGLHPIGVIDPKLAEIARQGHDVLRDANGNPTRGLNNSTVAVAEVEINGKKVLYASGSGATLSPAQRAKLEELGVPKENIFSGTKFRAGTKLENHAERVIERNLPEGAIIKKWGISWAGNQKNEMCGNCKEHFGHH